MINQENKKSALERIQEAVEYLLPLPLSLLKEEFSQRKLKRERELNSFDIEINRITNEGYEAAMRLMMPDHELLEQKDVPYFEQIEKLRGRQ